MTAETATYALEPESETLVVGLINGADDDSLVAPQLRVAGGTTDPTKDYLISISKEPVLKAEQEVELAMAIEAGLTADAILAVRGVEDPLEFMEALERQSNKGAEISSTPQAFSESTTQYLGALVITFAENANDTQLRQLVDVGRDARNRLFTANLKLVVSIAKRYKGMGMSYLDIIQEGNLGLNHAIELFDYRKGYKFSTYSTWWIRQSITRALHNQSRTIRLPIHMSEKIKRMHSAERRLGRKLGRLPTEVEVAADLNVTGQELNECRGYDRPPISLDMPIGEAGGRSQYDTLLGDVVPDGQPSVESVAVEELERSELVEIVEGLLSAREYDILMCRHVDDPGKTLDELGKKYGVTRERIRQIDAKVKNKLSGHPTLRKMFEDTE